MQYPAKYFYPLYKPQDERLFSFLVASAEKRDFPEIIGSDIELTAFIKLLVASQKMKDYRQFWAKLIESYENSKFNLAQLNDFGQKIEITPGIDESWAIFRQDKDICLLIDELTALDIKSVTDKTGAGEFFSRFLLTQLLQDWRGSLMAVCMTILESGEINFHYLNKLLSSWDLTSIWSKN